MERQNEVRMKIKICGLFRDEDIDYVNEARPDFIGFVLAESRRKVSPAKAVRLRKRLAEGIVPVGVFVNAPIADIIALYRDSVIAIAQLHGNEDAQYIDILKTETAAAGQKPIPVIKMILTAELETEKPVPQNADYYLIDSGAGSGKTFNWNILSVQSSRLHKPVFLAGGISLENIVEAIALNPFAIDVSSGAEIDGVKDRKKIIQLTEIVRKAL
jgi:phosphoribosylanthranilate isomerase